MESEQPTDPEPQPAEESVSPSDKPLGGQFFPPHEEGHGGLNAELKKPDAARLLPKIQEPADYQKAQKAGYIKAFDYLFELPFEPASFGPEEIAQLHGKLFGGLYRDAGRFRAQGEFVTIAGRMGADPGDIVPFLGQLRLHYASAVAAFVARPQTGREKLAPLPAIANYHGSFLKIHPFRDGNGRLSRLIAWWQELSLVRWPKQTIPRAVYNHALGELPKNLRPLLNVFQVRHGFLPQSFEPLQPLFPVWFPPSQQ